MAAPAAHKTHARYVRLLGLGGAATVAAVSGVYRSRSSSSRFSIKARREP